MNHDIRCGTYGFKASLMWHCETCGGRESADGFKNRAEQLQEAVDAAKVIADRLGCSDAYGAEDPKCDLCLLRDILAALNRASGKETN